MTTRVTSEQVGYILAAYAADNAVIVAICRDWLDMQARLGAMEGVVAAARLRVLHYLDKTTDDLELLCVPAETQALIKAVLAYDATQPAEDSDG